MVLKGYIYGKRETGWDSEPYEKIGIVRDSRLRLCCGLPNVSAWRIPGVHCETDHHQSGRLVGLRSQERGLTGESCSEDSCSDIAGAADSRPGRELHNSRGDGASALSSWAKSRLRRCGYPTWNSV